MRPRERDALQIRAFHAAYKSLGFNSHTSPTGRFAEAICMTSDEIFDEMLKTESGQKQVEKWLKKYLGKRRND